MNIFVLDPLPYVAAQQHCDKHVVKMILEYGQMLSTAHRLCDGTLTIASDPQGRKKPKKFWLFPGEVSYLNADLDEDGAWVYKWTVLNPVIYQVAHAAHPCSKWVRENDANYHWMFMLFDGLLDEYTHRYGRVHRAASMREFLRRAPMQIPRGQQTPFVQAMPEEYQNENVVEAYHRFYVGSKSRFAKWTNRDLPKWFERAMEGQDVSVFRRTRAVG
jgi:hypothetical protein